jgi:tetratricopeptide (TPR) repeat protein
VILAAVAAAAGGAWYVVRTRAAERADALRAAETARPADALPALLRVLENAPDDPEVLEAVIRLTARTGTVGEVDPYLDRLVALRPADDGLLRLRFRGRVRFGLREPALADARRILKLRPDDHDTRLTAGELAVSLGRYAEAEADFRYLLDHSPLPPAVPGAALANCYRLRGDRAAAEAALAKYAPAGDPPRAGVIRGVLQADAGRYEDAVATLRAALPAAAGDDRALGLYHLALSLEHLGRGDEARAAFDALAADERARRLTSDAAQRDDPAAQVQAARANLAADRPQEAVRLLESALRRTGDDPAALGLLADAYARLKRPDLAAAAKRRAAAAPPPPPRRPPGPAVGCYGN